ncbi:hypothetical protein [Veillonella caviae]|uniref:hypothetical protein n=1 Tax=Veillonella caviae TaxID=248316 RepID=UPI002A91642F|nr:hypothetical protein [Veillonella caviae]MDY6226003.1 hypothetical protein [Veillonella caviae]
MANINQYKSITEELEGRIDLLKRAIELDPDETEGYLSAIEYCEAQIDAARWVIRANKIVSEHDKKEEPTKEDKPKKSTKKKAEPKAEPKPVEEATPAVEEQINIFDMFGD